MIGLREDQQVKTQLVGKINALFFVVNGLAAGRPLTTRFRQTGGWVSSIEGRWLTSAYQSASLGLAVRQCRSGWRKSR
ncbi:hypothetical protein SAMN04490179_1249 [Pseudomonas antarctica]|uniref:Uncharacterized protein n=1 Tax=Pseudomonas antarctica TaxID=219572 RepID=A0A1G9WL59_9PSED|nr:hypothetical protein PSAN_18860 [Pseudomonas antarctica]SDM85278.1 hypothetical protein SAMN04490179_1249 [Pseudomonas antarctica]